MLHGTLFKQSQSCYYRVTKPGLFSPLLGFYMFLFFLFLFLALSAEQLRTWQNKNIKERERERTKTTTNNNNNTKTKDKYFHVPHVWASDMMSKTYTRTDDVTSTIPASNKAYNGRQMKGKVTAAAILLFLDLYRRFAYARCPFPSVCL